MRKGTVWIGVAKGGKTRRGGEEIEREREGDLLIGLRKVEERKGTREGGGREGGEAEGRKETWKLGGEGKGKQSEKRRILTCVSRRCLFPPGNPTSDRSSSLFLGLGRGAAGTGAACTGGTDTTGVGAVGVVAPPPNRASSFLNRLAAGALDSSVGVVSPRAGERMMRRLMEIVSGPIYNVQI